MTGIYLEQMIVNCFARRDIANVREVIGKLSTVQDMDFYDLVVDQAVAMIDLGVTLPLDFNGANKKDAMVKTYEAVLELLNDRAIPYSLNLTLDGKDYTTYDGNVTIQGLTDFFGEAVT